MPVDILKQAKDFWDKLGKRKKQYLAMGLAVLIAVSILAGIFLNRTNYQVLYSGLSANEQAQIVARIDELGIQYRTKAGGIIEVPEKELSALKMQLSTEGYPKSTLTYDLFANNSNMMATDYDKRQFMIFQLQDRLQEAIKTIKGVRNAIVNISIPENDKFVLVDEKIPPSASLIIECEPGVTLTDQQVKGIENLIAKSIPDLDNQNVTIIDADGVILNGKNGTASGSGIVNVELQKQASSIFEDKIISLLEPLYGKTDISVGVNVVIDFTRKTSQQVSYSPVSGNNPGNDDNQNEDEGGTTTTTRPGNDLMNQIINEITDEGGTIKDISAAIIINKQLNEQEKEDIRSLVSHTIGVEQNKVVVSDIQFYAKNKLKEAAANALQPKQPTFFEKYQLAFYIGGGVLFLAVQLTIILILRKRSRKAAAVAAQSAMQVEQQPQEVPAIVLNETREHGLKRQIRDFSASNPEIVAQLLRTWLREGED